MLMFDGTATPGRVILASVLSWRNPVMLEAQFMSTTTTNYY